MEDFEIDIMSTINVEVMKQLLQEFENNEALTTEEIKVVNEQIDELSGRIGGCRERLKLISEDKQKIAAMMVRYASDGSLVSIQPASSKAASPVNLSSSLDSESREGEALQNQADVPQENEVPLNEAGQTPVPLRPEATAQAARTVDADQQKTTGGHPLFQAVAAAFSPASQTAVSVEKEKTQEKKANSQPSSAAEEDKDDTVKSINDALRGLFR